MLLGGLLLLVGAGEVLVKGAVGLALRFRISTLVIGMTIVSLGTSAPELLVSLQAALEGHPDIATGNVVGSNISNIALVLGITALIFPIPVERDSIRLDWPAMMVATLLFGLFIQNGALNRWEGLLSIALLVGYITFIIWKSRRRANEDVDHSKEVAGNFWRDMALVAVGCVGLVFGAGWLLDGAVTIAQGFGVSEWMIGVTVVAFGTSVPELVTSGVAAFRKQTDISIGNLIGSNLFNLLAILGTTSVVTPIPIAQTVIDSDLWWLIGISAIILPIMLIGGRTVSRFKGALLVIIYGVYIGMVIHGG